MIVKVLMENTASREGLACAHGLSMYVETEHHKVLVDAGPDWQFAANAAAMGVDLAQIDTVFLSHGHYDHSGGLTEFSRLNDKALIYVAKGFDRPHYSADGRYIGVDPALRENSNIRIMTGDLKIDDELQILSFKEKKIVEDAGTAGMTEGRVDASGIVKVKAETFAHEHFLMVSEGNARVLFSGCTHRGIINVASWSAEYKPTVIVGGFHLMNVKPEKYAILDHVAAELKKYPYKYYTCHCTGQEQYDYLKEKMGGQLSYAATGDELVF